MKEINFGWFIFAGLILLGGFLVEWGLGKGRLNNIMSFFLGLASGIGIIILLFTGFGASYPLREILVRNTPMSVGVEQGMEVYFKYGCPNCHQIYGWGTPAGPDMGGIISLRGRNWFDEYMRNPAFRGVFSAMPDYSSLKRDEMDKLIEFLSAASYKGR